LSANISQHKHVFFTEQLQTLQSNIDHTVMLLPARIAMRNFGPIKVTADHYFMMGDNRDDSADSRYF
jgi:signal peptidase I